MTYSSNVPPLGKLSLNHTQDFSYIETPDNAAIDPTGGFTISVWAQQTGGEDTDGEGDGIVVKTWNTPDSVFGPCQISYGVGQEFRQRPLHSDRL